MRSSVRNALISLLLPAAASAAPFNAATATNEVGLDVFRQLGAEQPTGNLIVSPYSIESALALAYAGADGVTREELAKALHLPNDASADTEVMKGFQSVRRQLDDMAERSRTQATARARASSRMYTIENGKRVLLEPEPETGIQWSAANRLFPQKGYAFRDAYLELMRDGYAAPIEPLDFQHAAEKARTTINDWVSTQTKERITNLIPPGGVTTDTRLVLVNALYLKAPWNDPFNPHATEARPFHWSKSEAIDVPTMARGGRLPYEHENGLTVVALDYIGRELQCLILLPDEDRSVTTIAAQLTHQDFGRWAKLADHTPWPKVALFLPKFKNHGATLPLGETLRSLGMKTAFDEPRGSANFDRIAPRQPNEYLKLSEVYHQTFVALDEEGTEAAAATAASMSLAASYDPTKPIEVRVDRPFLFAIQHRPSGAVLFLGRIADPR